MKICVVGTGYVGLVAATCLAETGHSVVGIDVDVVKIEGLRKGVSPIYEPGLDELIVRNLAEGRLQFSTDLAEAVQAAEIVYIAVSTPEGEDGSADLRALMTVAGQVADAIHDYKVVVIKSTVPVGTNHAVAALMRGRTQVSFDVASNPEFLKEGTAVGDFMRPDRIIIGVESARARDILKYVYEPLVRTENPIFFMDPRSAEMSKYAANAFLATRISFMNEIARLCEALGADVDSVRRGMGSDSRIGYRFLFPGVGYGGSCFPKDVQALMYMGRQVGLDMEVVTSADRVNDLQKTVIGKKVEKVFGSDLRGKKIAVWGLAFKPGTDDMREAPSITFINHVLGLGAEVSCYDPVALHSARAVFGDRVHYARGNYDALEGADALVLITEWSEFRRPDFNRMYELMRGHWIFDGRNILDPAMAAQSGFHYTGMGRLEHHPGTSPS